VLVLVLVLVLVRIHPTHTSVSSSICTSTSSASTIFITSSSSSSSSTSSSSSAQLAHHAMTARHARYLIVTMRTTRRAASPARYPKGSHGLAYAATMVSLRSTYTASAATSSGHPKCPTVTIQLRVLLGLTTSYLVAIAMGNSRGCEVHRL